MKQQRTYCVAVSYTHLDVYKRQVLMFNVTHQKPRRVDVWNTMLFAVRQLYRAHIWSSIWRDVVLLLFLVFSKDVSWFQCCLSFYGYVCVANFYNI